MAKPNSNTGKREEVYVIPNASKPFIKLDPDGVHIIRTVRIPRYEEILIRKSVTRKIDHAQVTPEQFKVSYGYGTGRRCRDGANVLDAKGKKIDGKTTKGKKALLDFGLAHCDTRIEIMYGTRIGKSSQSGVSSVTRECRKLLIQFACKNLVDDKNKRYTAKTLPTALIKAGTLEAAKAEAKRIGVPKKKLDLLVKRGEGIAALMDDDTDMSI